MPLPSRGRQEKKGVTFKYPYVVLNAFQAFCLLITYESLNLCKVKLQLSLLGLWKRFWFYHGNVKLTIQAGQPVDLLLPDPKYLKNGKSNYWPIQC